MLQASKKEALPKMRRPSAKGRRISGDMETFKVACFFFFKH